MNDPIHTIIRDGFVPPRKEDIEDAIEHGYLLGAAGGVKGVVINPSGDWTPYWPVPEQQSRAGSIDTMGCASFNTLTPLETLLFFKYGVKANYSDRFTAYASGTVIGVGNNPHTVAESIRKNGVVEENVWPFSDDIKTPQEYYLKPPGDVYEKAKEWVQKWDFRHEEVFQTTDPVRVKHQKLREALTKGTVAVSVYAWQFDSSKGHYVKPQGAQDTHWAGMMLLRFDGDCPVIGDSYEPFEKKLSPDFDFGFAKVYYIYPREEKIGIFLKILDAMAKILGLQSLLLKKREEKPVAPDSDIPPPVPPTVPSRLSRTKEFAEAIKRYEGWYSDSRSHRNNNPGNLKYTTYTVELGAIAKDDMNFCVFPDYETGFGALCQFITDAATNKLEKYHEKDILGFFESYAPKKDKNNPLKYAEYVAGQLNLPVAAKLADIV